jgi:hypothetical protein
VWLRTAQYICAGIETIQIDGVFRLDEAAPGQEAVTTVQR